MVVNVSPAVNSILLKYACITTGLCVNYILLIAWVCNVKQKGGLLVTATILPQDYVIGVVTWDVEREVQDELLKVQIPDGCPPGATTFSSPDLGARFPAELHPGVSHTMSCIFQCFWWPSQWKDTDEFVSICPFCVHNL